MGSIVNKYRVHEVAKDFGVPTKVITEILTKYAQTPKNHMQVLDDRELSLIFEHLTQHNQVSGIQVIFAEGAKAAEKKQAEKPATAEKKGDKRQQAQPAGKPQQNQTPSKPMSRVPQTKVVDTRKAADVNLDKYDEQLEDHGGGPRRQPPRSSSRATARSSATASNARAARPSATSASRRRPSRMRRLQLEIAKKAPCHRADPR